MADPLDLDALEALAAKATPGPMFVQPDERGCFWCVTKPSVDPDSASVVLSVALEQNALLACEAWNSVPALVAEVRRLRAEINTLQANKEECDELASEEIARLRAKAARDAEALDALTTWVYEQAGEWSGWTDKMAAHRLVLLLRKTGREPLGGPP